MDFVVRAVDGLNKHSTIDKTHGPSGVYKIMLFFVLHGQVADSCCPGLCKYSQSDWRCGVDHSVVGFRPCYQTEFRGGGGSFDRGPCRASSVSTGLYRPGLGAVIATLARFPGFGARCCFPGIMPDYAGIALGVSAVSTYWYSRYEKKPAVLCIQCDHRIARCTAPFCSWWRSGWASRVSSGAIFAGQAVPQRSTRCLHGSS